MHFWTGGLTSHAMPPTKLPQHEVLLSIKTAAAILQVSDQTVRRWTTENLLPLHSRTEVGRYRRYLLSDVLELAAKRARKAG